MAGKQRDTQQQLVRQLRNQMDNERDNQQLLLLGVAQIFHSVSFEVESYLMTLMVALVGLMEVYKQH